MSSVNDPTNEASPQATARSAAVCFLITIVLGIVAEVFISGRLVVLRDPAATTTNITGNAGLFRLGFTLYLVEMAAQVAMTGALLSIAQARAPGRGAVVGSLWIRRMHHQDRRAPVLPHATARARRTVECAGGGFSGEQLNALAVLLLNVNDRGAAVALPFFGFSTILKGWLIVRSTFLPRWLGVLTIVGGAGWLAFLWQPLGYRLLPFIALVALVGSLAMILRLLVRGVDEPRWFAQARASAGRYL